MLNETDFRYKAEDAITALQRALERASEKHSFEVDRTEGALTIEFENPPTRFVVSPNSPVRQIWVSARVQSFKLDWNETADAFVLTDGRSLGRLTSDVIADQLGEPVTLT